MTEIITKMRRNLEECEVRRWRRWMLSALFRSLSTLFRDLSALIGFYRPYFTSYRPKWTMSQPCHSKCATRHYSEAQTTTRLHPNTTQKTEADQSSFGGRATLFVNTTGKQINFPHINKLSVQIRNNRFCNNAVLFLNHTLDVCSEHSEFFVEVHITTVKVFQLGHACHTFCHKTC